MTTTDAVPTRPGLAAVVLAAGRATRFGSTKQLAVVDGEPLVRHAVATARRSGARRLLVVVGHDRDEVVAALPDDVEVVENPDHARGQSTSVAAAVRAVSDDLELHTLLVLLADEPGLSVDAVEAVLDARRRGRVAVRAVYDDRPGHPVALASSTWPALLAGLAADRGAGPLLEQLGLTEVRVAGPAPTDVDTPEDLPHAGPR